MDGDGLFSIGAMQFFVIKPYRYGNHIETIRRIIGRIFSISIDGAIYLYRGLGFGLVQSYR